jgi:hypothetical protein
VKRLGIPEPARPFHVKRLGTPGGRRARFT